MNKTQTIAVPSDRLRAQTLGTRMKSERETDAQMAGIAKLRFAGSNQLENKVCQLRQ